MVAVAKCVFGFWANHYTMGYGAVMAVRLEMGYPPGTIRLALMRLFFRGVGVPLVAALGIFKEATLPAANRLPVEAADIVRETSEVFAWVGHILRRTQGALCTICLIAGIIGEAIWRRVFRPFLASLARNMYPSQLIQGYYVFSAWFAAVLTGLDSDQTVYRLRQAARNLTVDQILALTAQLDLYKHTLMPALAAQCIAYRTSVIALVDGSNWYRAVMDCIANYMHRWERKGKAWETHGDAEPYRSSRMRFLPVANGHVYSTTSTRTPCRGTACATATR